MCDHSPFLASCLDTIVFGSNNLETIPISVDVEFQAQENLNVFNVHEQENSELKMQIVDSRISG